MKAMRIHSYGGPEVLVYEEVPRPTISDDQVLVKVHAASINPLDMKARAGYLQGMVDYQFPFTPGVDLSGVVEEVGAQVTHVAVGDAVYGYSNVMRQGTYAEYVAVGGTEIAPKPETLDYPSAAAVPLAALAAWQALEAANLQPGQTILIHGAGGGVGTFAVQFARHRGARVLGTASSGKVALLHELGADEVIDYTTTRFEEVVHEVDVVLDNVAGEVQERSWAVLKPGGTLVCGVMPPDPAKAAEYGVRGVFLITQGNAAQLTEIGRLIDEGSVKPVISAMFPLTELRQAQAMLEGSHALGKVVVTVA